MTPPTTTTTTSSTLNDDQKRNDNIDNVDVDNVDSLLKTLPNCAILQDIHVKDCAKAMAEAFCDSPSYNYVFQDMKTIQQRIDILEWLFEKNIRLELSKCPTVLRGIVIENNKNNKDNDNETTNDASSSTSTSSSSFIVVCCFLWTPSPYHDHSLWEMIKAGLWQLPYRCKSIQALKRLLAAIQTHDDDGKQVFGEEEEDDEKDNVDEKDKDDKEETKNDNDEQQHEQQQQQEPKIIFVELRRMAVHPKYQGKGIGTRALQQTLQEHFSSSSSLSLSSSNGIPVRLSTQEERNVRFYRDRLGFDVILENDKFPEDTQYGYKNWFMVKKEL